ncbi:MAG: PilZ domain-containing protein [Candidatus Glassbacteria bacterium]|nr:PilZ domain-containing protein [Candidatus Glassbacteria bacterium]
MNYLPILLYESVLNLLGNGADRLIPRVQRWKAIQSGWAESSGGAMWYIIYIVGVILAGVAVFAVINQRREAKKRREREIKYFRTKAVDKELDEKQMKLLNEAVLATGLNSPYRVLDSFDIFQGMFQKYEELQTFSEQEHKYFHEVLDEIKKNLGFHKIEEAVQLENSREIRADQPVKVEIKKDGRIFEYPSLVVENSDKSITLDGSAMDSEFLSPDESTQVDVQFYREGDAGYNFSTTFLDPSKLAKGKMVLKHPAKLVRIQARNFSRMDVSFPFNFYHIHKSLFNKVEIDSNLMHCESQPVYIGETVDISGGGLALNARKKVSRGDYIYLNFQMLSEQLSEPLLAEVVWQGKDKEREIMLVRVKFYDITDKMRDELMRFVSQMQRKLARRMKFAPKR